MNLHSKFQQNLDKMAFTKTFMSVEHLLSAFPLKLICFVITNCQIIVKVLSDMKENAIPVLIS